MVNESINIPSKVIEKIECFCSENNLEIGQWIVEEKQYRVGSGKLRRFYQIYNGNEKSVSFIVKVIPVMDTAIAMSQDEYYRELAFIDSDLYKKVSEVFTIPIIDVHKDKETKESYLIMRDISEALDNFGPRKIPDRDTLIDIITKLGKFHAITSNHENIMGEHPWLMSFNTWVKNGCKLMESVIHNRVEEQWIADYLKTKPQLMESFPRFMDSLSKEQQELLKEFSSKPELILDFVNKSLRAVCHNDLFFPNIGKLEDEWFIIDWEFIGLAPTTWDVYSLFAGIPQDELKTEEMFEVYFSGLESEGVKVNREDWIESYRATELIEILLFGLRDLVPLAFQKESKLPEEHKKMIKKELDGMIGRAQGIVNKLY